MIIVQLAGGLGNQMQQYALYRKFLFLGAAAKLDASWFGDPGLQKEVYAPRTLELEYFRDLPMDIADPEEIKALKGADSPAAKIMRKLGLKKAKQFTESEMYHPELLSLREAYVTGYFACEKYYADILPQLRKDIVFPEASSPAVQEENERLIGEIGAQRDSDGEPLPVAVHLRRGDYLAPENASLLGGIATPAYYEGAAEAVRKACGGRKLAFYVFSDDPGYARTLHFGRTEEKNTVIDLNHGRDSLLDMRLMSCCGAEICANSTFSFWGCRLNGWDRKIMVRPSVHKNTQVFIPEQMHDLWQGWILVDREGREV